MPLFHLCPPLFLLGFYGIGLFLHPGLEPIGSHILTLAAAEQADQEGDDDNSTYHGQCDYQYLEVHPAEPPACIIQWTERMRWKDGAHWICYTRLRFDAPQARHVSQTFLTVCRIRRLTCFARCGSLSENCRQTEDKKQSSDKTP